MKSLHNSIYLVVICTCLFAVTSGCGKKVVRGSAISDDQADRGWIGKLLGKKGGTSHSSRSTKERGVQESLAQSGEGSRLRDADLLASAQEGQSRNQLNHEISGGSLGESILTTPSSTSLSPSGLPPSHSPLTEAFQSSNESAFSNLDDSLSDQRADGLFAENDGHKGVTFSNGLRDIYFQFDSWRLTNEAREILETNAEWLKTHPHDRITIEGHCDERGTQAYNYVLGEKRATMVQQYLAFLGVPHHQLVVMSFGKDRPTCRLFNESCFKTNRRAHFDSDVNVASQ